MSRLRRLVVSDRGFFITCRLGYNNRLLPSSISASSSNGTALSLSYSYFGNGGPNVIANNRDNGRTVTYGYDSLNRWNSASSQAATGADCWGQSVPAANANPPGYDRYGNLLTINPSKCSPPGLSISISVKGNNQVSGYSYDAAGDVTSDGTYSYGWDAENRLTSTAGVTYTYDGGGQRLAFAGLDPRAYSSGTSVHKKPRISNAGNKHLRHALYMPALVAVRHDPHLRGFYQHLLANGKSKMQAVVAVMRKLLHALHALFKSHQPYDGSKLFRPASTPAQEVTRDLAAS